MADESKPAPPPMMDAATYTAMLEKLVVEGKGFGKTTNVGAYLLPNLVIVTDTESGIGETKVEVKVEKFYIVMDLDQFRSEDIRKAVVKNIARHWGDKTIGEEDLNSADFKGAGLWTLKQSSFDTDYLPDTAGVKNGLWKPNPEAFRVTLEADKKINMPFLWNPDGFVVEQGGTIALREKDVKELVSALQQIRDGLKTAEEVLYKKNDAGKTVAFFDAYGMNPGFLKANYNPVSLKPETEETRAVFAAPAAKASAPKPA